MMFVTKTAEQGALYGYRTGHSERGTTDESADNVSQAIAQAVADNATIDLTDDKGRRIIVPAKALGYAIIGSETKHAVGFGTL